MSNPTPELEPLEWHKQPDFSKYVAEIKEHVIRLEEIITRLTAERDAQYDENVNRIAAEGAAILRAEAAEKRVKELEAEIKRLSRPQYPRDAIDL